MATLKPLKSLSLPKPAVVSLNLMSTEGTEIDKGSEIALIDTTLFNLQKGEIDAGMKGVRTRISSINAQNDILAQQIENLNVNISRI